MNKIENHLVNIVKKMDGKVLGFEIDSPKVLKQIDSNNNILEFNLLNNCNASIGTGTSRKKEKTVKYKKIRKKFGKKKYDTILCDYNLIDSYKRRFIADSIYVAKRDIYIIVDKEHLDIIEARYKRYKVSLDSTECKDGYLVKVELGKEKTHYFRDKFYLFIDYLYDIVDIIGDILMN